jgi:hypothetical protein
MWQLGTMQRRSRRSLPRRPYVNPPVPHAEFRQGLYHEAGTLTEAGAGRKFTNHRDAAVRGWRIAGNSGRSEGSQRTEQASPRTCGQKPPSLVQRRDAILVHTVSSFPGRRLSGNNCRMR